MKLTDRLCSFYKENRDILGFCFGLGIYFALAIIFSLPCPIVYATGVSCPGCGMTRAFLSLLKLDFAQAFYYHPLVFLLIPALVTLYILSKKKLFKARKIMIWVFAALLLFVYLYRFFVVKSPVLFLEPREGLLFRIFSFVFRS